MLMANNFTELFRTLDINHILVAKVLWVYVKPKVQTLHLRQCNLCTNCAPNCPEMQLHSSNNLLAGAPQYNGAVNRWS